MPGFPGLPCSSSGSSQQCCCFLPFTNSTGRGSTQGQDRRRGQFASDAHESAKDAYLLAQVTRVVFDGLQMTSNAVCNEGARSGCGHLHHVGQAQLQITCCAFILVALTCESLSNADELQQPAATFPVCAQTLLIGAFTITYCCSLIFHHE